MTRFYLALAIPILSLFTAFMVIIHAQPYDDHGLRALLIPDNCEIPCFMGIRPGVTTVNEAVRILDATGWVKIISLYQYISFVQWTWNGSQPSIFPNESGGGQMTFSYNPAKDSQVVGRVILVTSIPVGYAYLLFGEPNHTEGGCPAIETYIASIYTDHFVSIEARSVPCPVTNDKVWRSPMTVEFISEDVIQWDPLESTCRHASLSIL